MTSKEGRSNASNYELMKLDHLPPSWESRVIKDIRVIHRKRGNVSVQY